MELEPIPPVIHFEVVIYYDALLCFQSCLFIFYVYFSLYANFVLRNKAKVGNNDTGNEWPMKLLKHNLHWNYFLLITVQLVYPISRIPRSDSLPTHRLKEYGLLLLAAALFCFWRVWHHVRSGRGEGRENISRNIQQRSTSSSPFKLINEWL